MWGALLVAGATSDADARMNPGLLKPGSDRRSQVVAPGSPLITGGPPPVLPVIPLGGGGS